MDEIHPRDRQYTAQQKADAVCSYLRCNRLTTRAYFAIGIDPWRDRHKMTDRFILDALIATVQSLAIRDEIDKQRVDISFSECTPVN